MLDDERWFMVSEAKDIPEKGLKPIFPRGIAMMLFRRGEDVLALSNRCPHMGCPLTGGRLEGDVIICPCHDWAFDIRTGRSVLQQEIGIATYPVRIDGGKVFVKLEV